MAGTPQAQNGNVTSVASSATAITLIGANSLRQGLIIANASTAILYLLFASTGNATITTSLYSVAIPANTSGVQNYHVPDGYQGVVQAIWASANGTALVTELT